MYRAVVSYQYCHHQPRAIELPAALPHNLAAAQARTFHLCRGVKCCRWDIDGTSIFSVNEGKQMAQTPQRLPTAFEAKRLSKITQAALDTPLVQGYRLLPQFTPGRAFLWGSVLAAWATGALAMSTARSLGIHSVCAPL